MNFGNDQITTLYSETSTPYTVVGPSAWLGEMSTSGDVPSGPSGGTERNYSF
jgi:hypothetical protein